MSYNETLRAEVYAVIERKMRSHEAIRANWVAHSIINSHSGGLIEGDHKDFWNHCGYHTVRDLVRRCINQKLEGSVDESAQDKQLVMEGFDHLQTYYMVERDGEQTGVPVEHLTEEEVLIKAAHYRSMGAACYAHADELHRYLSLRKTPPLLAI